MAAELVEPVSSIPFDFWSALISAVFGLVSGVVASLVAPWVHRAIEKERERLNIKRQRLDEIRTMLDNGATLSEFERSSIWGFMDANFTSKERQSISSRTLYPVGPGMLSTDEIHRQVISKFLYRMETKWFK